MTPSTELTTLRVAAQDVTTLPALQSALTHLPALVAPDPFSDQVYIDTPDADGTFAVHTSAANQLEVAIALRNAGLTVLPSGVRHDSVPPATRDATFQIDEEYMLAVTGMRASREVRPFSTRVVGTIHGDAQTAQVWAVAAQHNGSLVVLSMTGAKMSLTAITARINHKAESTRGDSPPLLLPFTPADGCDWPSIRQLRRMVGTTYRNIPKPLPKLTEGHMIILADYANLDVCLQHPADPPSIAAEKREAASKRSGSSTTPLPPPPHFVFANAHEATPHPFQFLGHLRALSVSFLPEMAGDIWRASLHPIEMNGKPIVCTTPLPALGIRAWELNGDPACWEALLEQGIAAGTIRSRHTI